MATGFYSVGFGGDNNDELLLKLNNGSEVVSGAIKLDDIFNDTKFRNTLEYSYIDTSDPDVKDNALGTYDYGKDFQFLKQAWETTDKVENFWFTNDKGTILVLDKHNFYLKRKTGEVDDWNGDAYEVIEDTITDRTVLLGKDVIKYGVTNVSAKAGYTGIIQAYLWIVTLSDNMTMQVKFYSLDKANFLECINTTELKLIKRKLGEQLVPNNVGGFLYTYNDLQVSDFIFDAQFSATSIFGVVIFGIHVDNNFNQWAAVIDIGNQSVKVIQGYGFVGIDGTLTGGEIPAICFDPDQGGFTGTVFDVQTELNNKPKYAQYTDEINTLTNRDLTIVGDGNQQWYITREISGIVSHVEYSDPALRKFSIRTLPINNNYAAIYESPSFYTRTVTDFAVKAHLFSKLFREFLDNDKTATAIEWTFNLLTAAPVMWYCVPKLSFSGYLQQTIGQYAYVHYNSNSTHISKKDASDTNDLETLSSNNDDSTTENYMSLISEDELGFNTVIYKQSVDPKLMTKLNGFLVLTLGALQAGITSALSAQARLSVNAALNKSQQTDKGKAYSQYALQNISSMIASDMTLSGMTPAMTSSVASTLTLDMFYSTSNKQHIHAGPGYVNHNFVAQCVAQSATSNQFELNQITFKYIFKHLTLLQVELAHAATKTALDQILKTADYTNASGNSGGGGVVGTIVNLAKSSVGLVAAMVLLLSAAVLQVTLLSQEIFLKYGEQILDSMGADSLTSQITALKSMHNYDIEGKHKYGAKSESFMWPCWDCGVAKTYRDEYVVATTDNKQWSIHQSKFEEIPGGFGTGLQNLANNLKLVSPIDEQITHTTRKPAEDVRLLWNGDVDYFVASCYGKIKSDSQLPNDMAYVVGSDSFLSPSSFRNENIDCGTPVFPAPVIQDYIVDRDWQLSQTTVNGGTAWLSCKDTKIIDGTPSNIIITPWFCGVASPYAAIEIKHGVSAAYIRPWAVTPDALALNNTGKNAIYRRLVYHAFDGIGYRIVNWIGGKGMNKESLNYMYCFQTNDRFKRSNKLPPNQFMGNFNAAPIVSVPVDVADKLYNDVMMFNKEEGLASTAIGENRSVVRYAVPIFTEFVNTLPAAVKTLATYHLAVVDGVTSLCTDLRNTQNAYKAPESVDFVINRNVYRMTNEYICSVTTENGVVITEQLVPTLGLEYIGATPLEAFFYSQATRQYYSYSGGTNLHVIDMMERFRDIQTGRYDFISQEVVMQCLATFNRLEVDIADDEDETDNIMVLILKDSAVLGEIQPPTTNIFNTRSWFRILSLASGVVFQGPNRCVINRFIYSNYMLKSIKDNYGKWTRVPREMYHPFRTYKDKYKWVTQQIGDNLGIKGWTHNPFLLVTSPLGIDEETDCMFEWAITFAWPVEMDWLYADNNYATVNICAETMTPGGKVVNRPTHVFLTKELFTRTGNYGYYSFKYTSKNGAGNRERIHIWSDAYIAISALQCEYKIITENRTSQLTQQVDVQKLVEL